jgi:hypothetical protein
VRRFETLLGQIPADSQLNLVVRYSDGNNLAVCRLYDHSIEPLRASREAVGYDSSTAESGIEEGYRRG